MCAGGNGAAPWGPLCRDGWEHRWAPEVLLHGQIPTRHFIRRSPASPRGQGYSSHKSFDFNRAGTSLHPQEPLLLQPTSPFPPLIPKFPFLPWLHIPAGQTDAHTRATRAVGSSQGTTRATRTHPHAHPCHQHRPHREAGGLMRPPGGTPSIPFLSPNGAKRHIHPSPCSLQPQDGLQWAARSCG